MLYVIKYWDWLWEPWFGSLLLQFLKLLNIDPESAVWPNTFPSRNVPLKAIDGKALIFQVCHEKNREILFTQSVTLLFFTRFFKLNLTQKSCFCQIELTFVLIISRFLPNYAHICFDNQLIFTKLCSCLFSLSADLPNYAHISQDNCLIFAKFCSYSSIFLSWCLTKLCSH